MSGNRWVLTVHYTYCPKTTYLFFSMAQALQCAAIIKQTHPDICINLIRKEMTREQCEVVLSTGQLPT